MQRHPSYKITYSDLERVKNVAARIFDRSISPQMRLEIIARSAGFKSYAAFLAELKQGPVLLWGDQNKEEECVRQFNLDPAGVPYIVGMSLNSLLSAGLAWAEKDDVIGVSFSKCDEKLKNLKACPGKLTDYVGLLRDLEDKTYGFYPAVYSSSLSFADGRLTSKRPYLPSHPYAPTFVVVSPRNQLDLIEKAHTQLSGRIQPSRTQPGPWLAYRIPAENDPLSLRKHDDVIELDWSRSAASLLRGCHIHCFDDQDKNDILTSIHGAGHAETDPLIEAIDAAILYLDDKEEGSFFELGHYGATSNDLPETFSSLGSMEVAKFSLDWLLELVVVATSFRMESERLYGPNKDERPNLLRHDLLTRI